MRPTLRFLSAGPTTPRVAENLISIKNGTFYREYPSSGTVSSTASNPPLFPDLNFHLVGTGRSNIGKREHRPHVAVIGSNPTPFLILLRGGYICVPPGARTYPYLSSDQIAQHESHLRVPSSAIQYVGFNENKSSVDAPGGVRGAYLSARYESRREETDWSLQQYLRGETELNPSTAVKPPPVDDKLFSSVVHKLRLQKLLDLPVSHLSNGQTRRSRIAKALLGRPKLLLLDEPFMGLDPPTLVSLSPILEDMSSRSDPIILLGLRPQDPVPGWISHVVYLGENDTVVASGPKDQVFFTLFSWLRASQGGPDIYPAEEKLARALEICHGPPPSSVPATLTQHGIRAVPYEAAWGIARGARDKDTGILDISRAPTSQKWDLERRLAKPEAERNISDWSMLTTTLTQDVAEFLHSARLNISKKPFASATSEIPEKSETTLSSPSALEEAGEPLIELHSIVVKYGSKVVLGHPPPQPGFSQPGLNLTISRGTRLLLLGPNGSGKTTLLSLLTSDHPQSYSLPIKFFGRTRLPAPGKPGLSLWEIQSRIGHSSPEVHAFFPRGMTVRQVLESAWAETFSSKPKLTSERSALVDHFLKVWKPELCHDAAVAKHHDELSWASDRVRHPTFGQLSFGVQRLLLLLRAIIKQPDIIILDEAFSGLPTNTRIKALNWLEHGDSSRSVGAGGKPHLFPGLTDQQALVVVSHDREEIPDCIDEFVRLPGEEEATEGGKTVEIGKTSPGYMKTTAGWNHAWGLEGIVPSETSELPFSKR